MEFRFLGNRKRNKELLLQVCTGQNRQYPYSNYQGTHLARYDYLFRLLEAYSSLNKEGFSHLTVNHSINFVDPATGTHTNTMESTWRALKKSLPKNGTILCAETILSGQRRPFLELIKTVYHPSFEQPD